MRIDDRGDGSLDIFVTTPFDCLAARRVRGTVSRDKAVVALKDLDTALAAERTEIGPARDSRWPGALPPAEGFVGATLSPSLLCVIWLIRGAVWPVSFPDHWARRGPC